VAYKIINAPTESSAKKQKQQANDFDNWFNNIRPHQ
jgi:hypothetical protein